MISRERLAELVIQQRKLKKQIEAIEAEIKSMEIEAGEYRTKAGLLVVKTIERMMVRWAELARSTIDEDTLETTLPQYTTPSIYNKYEVLAK